MSYFPKRLMPNVVKKDSPLRTTSSNRITASDYNKHTDEIIAIERFLGLTGEATEQDILDIINGDDPKNILSVMSDFVERINIFIDGGAASSSGYIHHGQKMIFPENVLVCFLTQTPSPAAKTITVNSTLGFPENGIISILNDISATQAVPHSYVEWIKYSGKDSTRFLNCERGFLGTTAGGHVGIPPLTYTAGKNLADQCISLPLPLTLCNRRYPGYRLKTQYLFKAYGVKDTLVNLIRRVRKYPEDLDISPEFLGGSATNILDTAAGTEATEQEPAHPSILGRARDGRQILKSSEETFSNIHELTWDEAEFFITDLVEKEEIIVLKFSEDWITGPSPSIPVFNGRLSVSHTIAAVTMNPISKAETETPAEFAETLTSLVVHQSADGRAFISSVTNVPVLNRNLDQAIIQYKTFMTVNNRSTSDKESE